MPALLYFPVLGSISVSSSNSRGGLKPAHNFHVREPDKGGGGVGGGKGHGHGHHPDNDQSEFSGFGPPRPPPPGPPPPSPPPSSPLPPPSSPSPSPPPSPPPPSSPLLPPSPPSPSPSPPPPSLSNTSPGPPPSSSPNVGDGPTSDSGDYYPFYTHGVPSSTGSSIGNGASATATPTPPPLASTFSNITPTPSSSAGFLTASPSPSTLLTSASSSPLAPNAGLPSIVSANSALASHAATIAGGAVGGFLFLAFAVVGIFLWIRSRRVHTPPSAAFSIVNPNPPFRRLEDPPFSHTFPVRKNELI